MQTENRQNNQKVSSQHCSTRHFYALLILTTVIILTISAFKCAAALRIKMRNWVWVHFYNNKITWIQTKTTHISYQEIVNWEVSFSYFADPYPFPTVL